MDFLDDQLGEFGILTDGSLVLSSDGPVAKVSEASVRAKGVKVRMPQRPGRRTTPFPKKGQRALCDHNWLTERMRHGKLVRRFVTVVQEQANELTKFADALNLSTNRFRLCRVGGNKLTGGIRMSFRKRSRKGIIGRPTSLTSKQCCEIAFSLCRRRKVLAGVYKTSPNTISRACQAVAQCSRTLVSLDLVIRL